MVQQNKYIYSDILTFSITKIFFYYSVGSQETNPDAICITRELFLRFCTHYLTYPFYQLVCQILEVVCQAIHPLFCILTSQCFDLSQRQLVSVFCKQERFISVMDYFPLARRIQAGSLDTSPRSTSAEHSA